MATLDRTNIDNGWYQLRAGLEDAFASNEALLGVGPNDVHSAVVLHASKATVVPRSYNRNALESSLMDRLGQSHPSVEQYVVYFRVPLLHSNLPLPPSFRNIVRPENYPNLKGHTAPIDIPRDGSPTDNQVFAINYNPSSLITPAAEEELLISCHPSLLITTDPSNTSSNPGKLNPGDVIGVRFKNRSFSSAEFIKVVSRGLNIVRPILLEESPIDLFDGKTFDISDYPNVPQEILKLAFSYDSDSTIPRKNENQNKLNQAHVEMIPYIKAFIYLSWTELKIEIRINSTYRSPRRQKELLKIWNDITYPKYLKDLEAWKKNPVGDEPEKPPGKPGERSWHLMGAALDFNAYLEDGTKYGKTEPYKNKAENKEAWLYTGLPAIGEQLNLQWGGNFGKNYDPIHFDMGHIYTTKHLSTALATAAAENLEPRIVMFA